MSKLIDALNQQSQGESQSIGFTQRVQTPVKPKIKVVVSLAAETAMNLTGHVAEADAGLIVISKAAAGAETLQKLSSALPDIPWGTWLGDPSSSKIKQLFKAGADFIIFSADDTSVVSDENEKIDTILAVEKSIEEGLLRAANELPLDAILITGDGQGQSITWQKLLLFKRFSDLLTKPLLVSVSPKATASELKLLWEAGVRGVVLDIDEKQPEDRIKKLRQEIDKLDFSSPRKSNKAAASLPRTGRESGATLPEIEEDEY